MFGHHVLGYLSVLDLILLERSAASKTSRQIYLNYMPYCPSIQLCEKYQQNLLALNYFQRMRCPIYQVKVCLPAYNLGTNFSLIDKISLEIIANINIANITLMMEPRVGLKVISLIVKGNQDVSVMKQLSSCIPNVTHLCIHSSVNYESWIDCVISAGWKLDTISVIGSIGVTVLLRLRAALCPHLEVLKLAGVGDVNDSTIATIAQSFPKLRVLALAGGAYTHVSLMALSERGLPLEELVIPWIPPIPKPDRSSCMHALSRIRKLCTARILTPLKQHIYALEVMRGGLQELQLSSLSDHALVRDLLQGHCAGLQTVLIGFNSSITLLQFAALVRCNRDLRVVTICHRECTDDAVLIALAQNCPQLQELRLQGQSGNMSDTALLALSTSCPQLRLLSIAQCRQVSEGAVLQLLQRRTSSLLHRLEVALTSLSEETALRLKAKQATDYYSVLPRSL